MKGGAGGSRKLVAAGRTLMRYGFGMFTVLVLLYGAALLALRLLGYEFAVVVSDSMRPTIARGDLVLLREPADLIERDVVMFRRGDTLVLHRLVEELPAGAWRTRGDANSAADPWRLPVSDVVGEAMGVLHGFGTPLLLWSAPPAAAAGWAGRSTSSASAVAKYWQSPTMNWTNYGSTQNITTGNPATVTISGTGERRLYAASRYSGNSRLHLEGRLTQTDAGAPGWLVLLNACAGSNDALSCGWAVLLDNSQRRISLHTVLDSRTIGSALASCDWPSGLSLTSAVVLSVQRIGTRILAAINGSICLNVPNASALAAAAGQSSPGGNHTGLWLRGNNRFYGSKVVVW